MFLEKNKKLLKKWLSNNVSLYIEDSFLLSVTLRGIFLFLVECRILFAHQVLNLQKKPTERIFLSLKTTALYFLKLNTFIKKLTIVLYQMGMRFFFSY